MSIVLVIDDDSSIRSLVKAYLDGTNYQVLEAKDAFEAEDIIYRYRVALILVDINMPFQNGFDFVQKLKRSSRNKLISTVFMTARSDKRDVERAAGLQVDGYIVKPFKGHDLIKKVDDLFSTKKASGPSYRPIDLKALNYSGQVLQPINFEVENISEIGLTIRSHQDLTLQMLSENTELTIKSVLWSEIGIAPPPVYISSCSPTPVANRWTVFLIFKSLEFETLEVIRAWIERTHLERQ